MSTEALNVLLDWTPNVNHAGFFVAQAKGWYASQGISVNFISPHQDGYSTTQAESLKNKTADIAICPSETVVSSACQPPGSDKPRLVAVAAVLTEDTSAIVTLRSSGLARPRDLDGRRYASYAARYEGRIVQQLIKNDGGSGDFVEDVESGKLGVWDALVRGGADATWVFMGWEGVIAEREGVDLNAFKLSDYNVPYGYSPIMVVTEETLNTRKTALKAFLAASALGWKQVVANPQEAADAAYKAMTHAFSDAPLPEPLDPDVMLRATQYIARHVMPESGKWGQMEESRWSGFLDWLSDSGLLTTLQQSRKPQPGVSVSLDELRNGNAGERIPRESIPASSLFTNDCLLP